MSSVREEGTLAAEHARPPAGSGARAGRAALWLLLAIPVALAVFVAWEFAMQTSAGYNETERIYGWRVALRELPATVLLLVPVAAGLVLGTRSARSGSRKGVLAIWAHAAALLLLLLMIVSDAAESVTTPPADVGWEALLLAAGGAAGALLLCLRAVRRPYQPFDGWSRPALALPLVGVVASFLWLFGAQAALTARAGGFARAAVPGAVTVAVDEPGTRYVYAEGNAPDALADLGVEVTDPSGRAVAVDPMVPSADYLRKLRGGRAVGSFRATQAGDYRIVATAANLPPVTAPFAPAEPNGQFAVGGSVEGWMRPHEWGAAVVFGCTVGEAVVLALRRRSRP